MHALFETLASPFFAVVDFALAAPAVVTAMVSAGAIVGIVAVVFR